MNLFRLKDSGHIIKKVKKKINKAEVLTKNDPIIFTLLAFHAATINFAVSDSIQYT